VGWDVATYWLRGAHLFAPPCYGEQTIPQLLIRIGGTRDPVVILAGHSKVRYWQRRRSCGCQKARPGCGQELFDRMLSGTISLIRRTLRGYERRYNSQPPD
jgi:hypothetical protein